MSSVSVFEATRLNLSRLTAQGQQDLLRGFVQAAQASAQALQVARVGVWFISPDTSSLLCCCLCGPGGLIEVEKTVLNLVNLPRYTEALLSRRVVMAHDAWNDQETCELAEFYLKPNQIRSMLDAPIYRAGEVIGVVCHEHVGSPRTWSDRERDLACSVSEIVSILLEQADRIDGEGALRAQAARSERLERDALLARFAAGIAHDFNNILATVLLQVEHARHRADGPLRSELDGVVQFLDVGRGLVAQLLAYSKEAPFEPRMLHWPRHLQGQQRLLEMATSGRHRLNFHVTSERAVVHADATQLNQMMLNLVLNARDAMPDGGEIQVSLEASEEWVEFSVKDQGHGIDKDVQPLIFEPFFTTKGAGTGLGLSTVRSIVQRHGGQLDVESSPGAGARFLVRLPRVDG